MSILSTVKKGTISIKTASGYVKLLPRTLASLVSMNDGTDVESKINTINTNLSALPKPADFIIAHGYANNYVSSGEWQWEYIKLNNGLMFLWRCVQDTNVWTTSNSSANGTYYSNEITWNTFDDVGMTKVLATFAMADRRGNSGLPWISLINSWVENGIFYMKFIIVGNNTSTYTLSPSIFVVGRWD